MQNRVIVVNVSALGGEGWRGSKLRMRGAEGQVRFHFEVLTGKSPVCSFVSQVLTLCSPSSGMCDSSVVYQPKSL